MAQPEDSVQARCSTLVGSSLSRLEALLRRGEQEKQEELAMERKGLGGGRWGRGRGLGEATSRSHVKKGQNAPTSIPVHQEAGPCAREGPAWASSRPFLRMSLP